MVSVSCIQLSGTPCHIHTSQLLGNRTPSSKFPQPCPSWPAWSLPCPPSANSFTDSWSPPCVLKLLLLRAHHTHLSPPHAAHLCPCSPAPSRRKAYGTRDLVPQALPPSTTAVLLQGPSDLLGTLVVNYASPSYHRPHPLACAHLVSLSSGPTNQESWQQPLWAGSWASADTPASPTPGFAQPPRNYLPSLGPACSPHYCVLP